MLSEIALRILSELEEAGEENIPAMLNTIIDGQGASNEVPDYQHALRELVTVDLVRMTIERDASRRLAAASKAVSFEEIDRISTYLRFDHEAKLWRDSRRSGPPFPSLFPQIVCTEAGRRKAFEILDERGYQWWRKKA